MGFPILVQTIYPLMHFQDHRLTLAQALDYGEVGLPPQKIPILRNLGSAASQKSGRRPMIPSGGVAQQRVNPSKIVGITGQQITSQGGAQLGINNYSRLSTNVSARKTQQLASVSKERSSFAIEGGNSQEFNRLTSNKEPHQQRSFRNNKNALTSAHRKELEGQLESMKSLQPLLSLETIKNRQQQRKVNHSKQISQTENATAYVKNLDIYKDALDKLTLQDYKKLTNIQQMAVDKDMLQELKEREHDLDSRIRVLDKQRRELERAFTRKDKSVGVLNGRGEQPHLRHGFKSQASLNILEGQKLHFKEHVIKNVALESNSSSDSTAEDQVVESRLVIPVVSAMTNKLFDSAVSDQMSAPVKNTFAKTSHSQKPFPRQYHPHIQSQAPPQGLSSGITALPQLSFGIQSHFQDLGIISVSAKAIIQFIYRNKYIILNFD